VFSTLQVSVAQRFVPGHGLGAVGADAVTGAAEAVAGYSSLFRSPVSGCPMLRSRWIFRADRKSDRRRPCPAESR
jgi:hypothetical protein